MKLVLNEDIRRHTREKIAMAANALIDKACTVYCLL